MKSAKVKVTLEDYRSKGSSFFAKKPFKVVKVVNSITYTIGDFLSEQEVNDLIYNEVTIELKGTE